jgi:hypothetical protein
MIEWTSWFLRLLIVSVLAGFALEGAFHVIGTLDTDGLKRVVWYALAAFGTGVFYTAIAVVMRRWAEAAVRDARRELNDKPKD